MLSTKRFRRKGLPKKLQGGDGACTVSLCDPRVLCGSQSTSPPPPSGTSRKVRAVDRRTPPAWSEPRRPETQHCPRRRSFCHSSSSWPRTSSDQVQYLRSGDCREKVPLHP